MNINEELTLDNILEKIASMPLRGYRFVTMTTVDCGDTFDIYYHFDRRYKLNNLRLKVAHGAKVPSISRHLLRGADCGKRDSGPFRNHVHGSGN